MVIHYSGIEKLRSEVPTEIKISRKKANYNSM